MRGAIPRNNDPIGLKDRDQITLVLEHVGTVLVDNLMNLLDLSPDQHKGSGTGREHCAHGTDDQGYALGGHGSRVGLESGGWSPRKALVPA